MRYVVFVVVLALTPLISLCQDSRQFTDCNAKAKTQRDINACAADEASRADSELNSVYSALLSKLETQPEVAEKIKIAERAWTAYRDAYIEAMYPAKDKQAEYGSEYPTEVDLLRAKLSRQQVAALKALLRQHSN